MAEIFAIVIPYYQRDPLVLRRAVRSILAQKVPKNIEVKIVIADDSSPCPPSESLNNLDIKPPFVLKLLKQKNGGAASARNLGLASLSEDMPKYCAFLDSDDEWLPGHIKDAVEHIDKGADFWFTDSYDDEGRTSFSYQNYMISRHDIGENSQPVIRALEGQEAFNEILEDCLPHTSTVVFHYRKSPQLRFDTTLKIAGEDHLFWISAIAASSKVMYSTALRGRRGEGVSIFRHNLNWDSPNAIDIAIYQTLLRERISTLFDLTAEQRSRNEEKRQKHYDRLTFLITRKLLKKPSSVGGNLKKANALLKNYKRQIPGSVLRLPSHRADIRHKLNSAL